MDENLQELENELRRLAPRNLSARTFVALEHELGSPTVRRDARESSHKRSGLGASRSWMPWALAMAAALVLVALFQARWFLTGESSPAAIPGTAAAPAIAAEPVANRYQPVQATTVLYDMKEIGRATLADQTEARKVRYRYVDTYTWKNPTTNASLRWSVPRDEVRLVRASLD